MCTKPAWLRSPPLHDAAAVIVIVRDSTRLQAISLLINVDHENRNAWVSQCLLLVCHRHHGGRAEGQEQSDFLCENSFFIVWSPYMAALSRGCKPRMGGFPLHTTTIKNLTHYNSS